MQIIDKNKDYYDFYQNVYRDDIVTFDRRDSYDLSRKTFAGHFYMPRHHHGYSLKDDAQYVLLQVGYHYWLFALKITKTNEFDKCLEYELSLLGTWTDYANPAKPIKLSQIRFPYYARDMISSAQQGNYKTQHVFERFVVWKGEQKEERHIPILKDLGIPQWIEPLDIYLALEEYFMKQKTDTERIDPIGQTNDDKIIVHGFDTETSFRGK